MLAHRSQSPSSIFQGAGIQSIPSASAIHSALDPEGICRLGLLRRVVIGPPGLHGFFSPILRTNLMGNVSD